MHKCKIEILSTSSNGKIFFCDTCDKIHIEYKNLNFIFSKEEFGFFRDYFIKLDPAHWAAKNKDSHYHRKIMVPIGHKNFTAIFNIGEIQELKHLLTNDQSSQPKLIKLKYFKTEFVLN